MAKIGQELTKVLNQSTENTNLCNVLAPQLQVAATKTRERYGDAQQFMLTFNRDMQIKVANNLERCYTGTAPNLVTIKTAYSEDVMLSWLMIQLENINDFCGVRQKMTLEQMDELAKIIATEYYFLKATEFLLFLYRFKLAKYGEFYGVIDPQRILAGLASFSLERVAEISAIERVRATAELELKRQEWAKTGVSRKEYYRLKKLKYIRKIRLAMLARRNRMKQK